MNHSPGPWRWDYSGWATLRDANDDPILVCARLGHPNGDNARLIAAAPELLEALREAVETLDNIDANNGVDTANDVIRYRALIARIEGK